MKLIERLTSKLTQEQLEKIRKAKESAFRKTIKKVLDGNQKMKELITIVYGLDSQILMDYLDELNKISIDQDREDS